MRANLDQIQTDIERGRAVLRATGSAVSFLDRSAEMVQDAISVSDDVSSAVQLWRTGSQSNPVRANPLDLRRAELAVWSALAERTRPGRAQIGDWSSVVQSVAAIHPLGLAVTTAVTLFDDYLERRTFQQGYEKLKTAMDQGFAGVRDTLGSGLLQLNRTIESGFQRLSVEFSWGLAELMWRADQENQSLAEIRDLLTHPLDVQSKELRARAIRSYDNGWMDEARLDFLDAMEKSRVDYVVAHYLGNIYLRSGDYEAAADWFGKSARWSRPEEPRHAAVALMHQALALSLRGTGGHRDAIACLDGALDLDPANIEARFQRAQLCVRDGNPALAVVDLEEVIEQDGRYLARALVEPDFQEIGNEIADLVYWLTKSYSKTVERHLRLFIPFVEHIDKGIKIDSIKAAISPYLGSDVEAFTQAVRLAASLYAVGDFHSIQQAQALLLALPSPETQQHPTLHDAAVEHLGHKEASLRLLRSLEQLAQDEQGQRQTVVDVICAYLRTSFEPLGSDGSQSDVPMVNDPSQDLQVRLEAQRLLARHLSVPNSGGAKKSPANLPTAHWQGIQVNLAGAMLVDANFSRCRFQHADFQGAVFYGDTWFAGSTFGEDVEFTGALFKGDAIFGGRRYGKVIFDGKAIFDEVSIEGDAWFGGALFRAGASFGHVTFGGLAVFVGATFNRSASFAGTVFRMNAEFGQAGFQNSADFGGSQFMQLGRFGSGYWKEAAKIGGGSVSHGAAWFSRTPTFANVHAAVSADHVWPRGVHIAPGS